MARCRNIKPGLFKNEVLADVDIATRYLFVGLWTLADREGRLEDRPKRIKVELFPWDDIDVDAALDDLAALKDADGTPAFIVRYSVNGASYIQIRNFLKHQHPHHREQESPIPAPDMPLASLGQAQGQPEASLGQAQGQAVPRRVQARLDPGSGILDPDPDPDPREPAGSGPLVFDDGNSTDNFRGCEKLRKAYPGIMKAIQRAHPKAKMPAPGSNGDREAQAALEQLVRLDKYSEDDVLGALRWLFGSEDERAVFWRDQVQALKPLRVVKNGMSKFGRIHEAWQRAESGDAEDREAVENLRRMKLI